MVPPLQGRGGRSVRRACSTQLDVVCLALALRSAVLQVTERGDDRCWLAGSLMAIAITGIGAATSGTLLQPAPPRRMRPAYLGSPHRSATPRL